MPEPRLISLGLASLHVTSLRIPAVNLDSTVAERDGDAPAPPRSDRRPPVQARPARARRVPPPVRNLPRRSGY